MTTANVGKTGKNVKMNHTLKLTITKKLISVGGIKEVFFTKTILTYGQDVIMSSRTQTPMSSTT